MGNLILGYIRFEEKHVLSLNGYKKYQTLAHLIVFLGIRSLLRQSNKQRLSSRNLARTSSVSTCAA